MNTDLQIWFNDNQPDENLLWKNALDSQVIFFRDKFSSHFYKDYEEKKSNPPTVISTHTSKSVTCPVYQIKLDGFLLVARYNFYNWNFSVKSDIPLVVENWFDLLDVGYLFFEGFPTELQFEGWKPNKVNYNFSSAIFSHEAAWMFGKILAHSLERGR